MSDAMTKVQLLQNLESARADWEQMLSELEPARAMQPETLGTWSIKDVIAHVTSHTQAYVQALEADLRGEPPPPEMLERIPFDERNAKHVEQHRQKGFAEMATYSRQLFRQLTELTDAHSEQFLTEPQRFPGVPEPVLVYEQLLDNVRHTRDHLRDIRDALKEKA